MTKKLQQSLSTQKSQSTPMDTILSGLLGLDVAGTPQVDVPERNGFVYVRLRQNSSEVIQAFNNKVSQIKDLPVLIHYVGHRYEVIGIDSERYGSNWPTTSYLPNHGNQHSLPDDFTTGIGGDTTFVYPRQVMPMLAYPNTSGSYLTLASYIREGADGTWSYDTSTGTANLLSYVPSSGAVMALLYKNYLNGSPSILLGNGFSATLTGTSDIVKYIPNLPSPSTNIPIAAVRLVSGTSSLSWDNVLDLRQWWLPISTGSAGGGISDAPMTGLQYGRQSGTWTQISGSSGGGIPEAPMTGLQYGRQSGTWTTITGTSTSPAGSSTQIQYNNSGSFGADAEFTFDSTSNELVIGTIPSIHTSWGMNIVGSGTAGNSGYWSSLSGTSATSNIPFISGFRSNVSGTSPSAILYNMGLFRIAGRGYDGSAWGNTQAQILLVADGDWNSSSHPSRIDFYSTKSGSTSEQLAGSMYDAGMNLPTGSSYMVGGVPIQLGNNNILNVDLAGITVLHNWLPTGIYTPSIIRLAGPTSGGCVITGIRGGWDGRILTLQNVDNANITDSSYLQLIPNSTLSSEGNRFSFGNTNADLFLYGGSSVTLIYNSNPLGGGAGIWELLNNPIRMRALGSVFSAPFDHTHNYTLSSVGAPTGDVSWANHKIINLSSGTNPNDAATFGQIPTSLPPNGLAGGDLSGTYPNPTIRKQYCQMNVGGNLVGSTVATGTTTYFGHGVIAFNATEAQNRTPVCAGVAKNFYVRTSSAQAAGGTFVFTVMKNSVAQALAITITGSSTANIFSDTAHSFVTSEGDEVDVRAVNNGSAASAAVRGWGFEIWSG